MFNHKFLKGKGSLQIIDGHREKQGNDIANDHDGKNVFHCSDTKPVYVRNYTFDHVCLWCHETFSSKIRERIKESRASSNLTILLKLDFDCDPLEIKEYGKRAIRIALKAKNKLGFIDGSCLPPTDASSEKYFKWSDADSMVVSWLHHSMTKDLMEAYMFTPSARELWLELEEKFGATGKSHIYDLRKQLIQMMQGTDSLALYSNKQKKLIDELNCLDPKDPCICNGCSCGGYKKLVNSVASNDTYSFLRGLNETYSNTVSTILLMEPLPSYNKVYSLVSRIEAQRTVGVSNNVVIEASALAAKAIEQVKNTYNSSSKKKDYGKKGDRFCVHCNKPGHLEEACFKKHGYPEWFKEYKNKKTQQNTTLAATNTTNATEMQQKSSESNLNSALIAQMVQMEVQKLMKSKNTVQESPVSTSYLADFTGNLSNSALKYGDNWVVDSGASSHITGNKDLLKDLRPVNGKNTVTLPDGSVKYFKFIGCA
ncbi:uncharacterized protein G2W53_039526 [Senna tora]|uniref:Retrotransposon gag domain-containing protein n=1 Tax=Senna tora TaxID=362788 RepID=A0A834W2X6_9FABA|nr:uncharacterized protein G2W53_039526 [Senna tora]